MKLYQSSSIPKMLFFTKLLGPLTKLIQTQTSKRCFCFWTYRTRGNLFFVKQFNRMFARERPCYSHVGQTRVNFEIHQDSGSVMKYDDSLLDDSVLRNSLVGHIILDDTCWAGNFQGQGHYMSLSKANFDTQFSPLFFCILKSTPAWKSTRCNEAASEPYNHFLIFSINAMLPKKHSRYSRPIFRSARTSCTTSGGPVRPSARVQEKFWALIYRHICLMNHEWTHKTNPMAPWDSLDAPLDPLASHIDPLGPPGTLPSYPLTPLDPLAHPGTL